MGKYGEIYGWEVDNAKKEISYIFERLFYLAPLIERNLILIVTKPIFDQETGVDDFKDDFTKSPIGKLVEIEKTVPEIRSILSNIYRFSDDIEDSMSDNQFNVGNQNKEGIQFYEPLFALCQDLAFQTINQTNLLCVNQCQFDTLIAKGHYDEISAQESVWQSKSLLLPEISNIDLNDLVRIRDDEVIFSDWRNSVGAVSRQWRSIAHSQSNVSGKQMEQIFDHELMPIRHKLEAEVSKSRFGNLFESSAVSFAAGAVSSVAIRPDPSIALAIGGMSALIKITYDLSNKLKKDMKSSNRIYLKYLPVKGN